MLAHLCWEGCRDSNLISRVFVNLRASAVPKRAETMRAFSMVCPTDRRPADLIFICFASALISPRYRICVQYIIRFKNYTTVNANLKQYFRKYILFMFKHFTLLFSKFFRRFNFFHSEDLIVFTFYADFFVRLGCLVARSAQKCALTVFHAISHQPLQKKD